MRMKNNSGSTLKIAALQLTISPGAETDIPDGYCIPRKGANGEYQEPIIAMLAPQLEPANPDLVAAYRANKLLEGLNAEPVPPKRASAYEADGVAPAVAEMMASGSAASVPKVAPKAPNK